MKQFTESQIDDLIMLKFGKLVEQSGHLSYVSNRKLGKIFKCSGSKIRQLYTARFESREQKDLSSFLRSQQERSPLTRKRYGLRFLKKHEISWITSSDTLRRQVSFSLKDRCQHFLKEFPTAKINPTLLR